MTMNEPRPANTAELREFCRKACATWLIQLAQKIADGTVDGFDLKWAHDAEIVAPMGVVNVDPQFMRAPLPDPPWIQRAKQEAQAAVEKAQAEAAAQVAALKPLTVSEPVKRETVKDRGRKRTKKKAAPVPRLGDERAPIQVEDLSEKLKGAKPCTDPNCANCKNKA